MKRGGPPNLNLRLLLFGALVVSAVLGKSVDTTESEPEPEPELPKQNSTTPQLEERDGKEDSAKTSRSLKNYRRVEYGTKPAYSTVLVPVQTYNPTYNDFPGVFVRYPGRDELLYQGASDEDIGDYGPWDNSNDDYENYNSFLDAEDINYNPGLDDGSNDDNSDLEVFELPPGSNFIQDTNQYIPVNIEGLFGRQANPGESSSNFYKCKFTNLTIYTNNRKTCEKLKKSNTLGNVKINAGKPVGIKKLTPKRSKSKKPGNKVRAGDTARRQQLRWQQLMRQHYNSWGKMMSTRRDYNRRSQSQARKRVQHNQSTKSPMSDHGRRAHLSNSDQIKKMKYGDFYVVNVKQP